MNLNELSYKTLIELAKYPGVLKKESRLDSKKITVFDVGVSAKLSSKEAFDIGVQTAIASTGNLAAVKIKGGAIEVSIPKHVALATLCCQMAGWAVKVSGDNAMGSGPARVLARQPKNIFEKIKYNEVSSKAALVLEAGRLPDSESLMNVLEKTGAQELVVAAFKGDSGVGIINVLARVVELAVYRLDFLGYDVRKINSAKGSVTIPKTMDMCNSNDALIYKSNVELEVESWDPSITDKCVSKSCGQYGKKFREIFDKAGCDFYKIDESIFAPAKVKIIDKETGKTYEAGACV